jgi:hypothetical protein
MTKELKAAETPSPPLLSSLSPLGRIRFKLINIRGEELFNYPCYAQNWYEIHKEFGVWIQRASKNIVKEVWNGKQFHIVRVVLLHEDVLVTCLELKIYATTSSQSYIGYFPAEVNTQIDLHRIDYKKYFTKQTENAYEKAEDGEGWKTIYHYFFNFNTEAFLSSLTADVDLSFYFLPEPEAKRPLNIWSLGK